MKIQLSEHFTYRKLLTFVFPSIVMMIFTSIYSVVDGLFVSNYVGKTALAAINLILPFMMGISALGFMIGTGGSAIVGKTLGEGRHEKANEYFSMLVYVTAVLGIVVTAEKPKLGLGVILTAGVTNMVLDLLFVGIFGWGLAGAGVATVCGELIGGLFPIFYFGRKNSSLLRLGRTHFHGDVLLKTCVNGSSELMTNVSSSIVNALYNMQLMALVGENGVASYGTIMYVNFVFISIFLGYSIGSAPIISYHYGAGNGDELRSLFRKSLRLISAWGVGLAVLAQLLAYPAAKVFVGYDSELLAMTEQGFRIFCLVYLINGFNIFGSSFFTALNNGVVSAVISFLRTLVFQIGAVLILPSIFGMDGIWSAVVVAELLTLCVTLIFFAGCRKKYHYA